MCYRQNIGHSKDFQKTFIKAISFSTTDCQMDIILIDFAGVKNLIIIYLFETFLFSVTVVVVRAITKNPNISQRNLVVVAVCARNSGSRNGFNILLVSS